MASVDWVWGSEKELEVGRAYALPQDRGEHQDDQPHRNHNPPMADTPPSQGAHMDRLSSGMDEAAACLLLA